MIELSVTITGHAYQGFQSHYTYRLGRFATEAGMVARVRELRADDNALWRIAGDFASVTSARFEATSITCGRTGDRAWEHRETWTVRASRAKAAA